MKQRIRVLIVEDQEDDALLVVRELEKGGFAVEFERVDTAADLLRAMERTDWDIVISDYTMPRFSGPTALRMLRDRDPILPFIFMSGTIGEETAVAVMRDGATDYLLKDRPGRLSQAVSQALEQRRLRLEHTQTQKALEENQRRTRMILDTANDAFVAMDAGGIIVDWNRRAEAIFGWKRDEAIGALLSETIIPPSYREAYARGLQRFLATGESAILNQRTELVGLHRDGREFPVEVVVWPVIIEGKVTFCAFVRDISRRKQAEADLRKSEERYRLLFENNPQPMWAFDVETLAFLAVNEAAIVHYGYPRDEFLRMTIRDIQSAEAPSQSEARHSKPFLAMGEAGVFRHRKKDGTMIEVETASYELAFDGRKARLMLVIDVTERRRAQMEGQRLISILEATPDLVAISHVDGFASYINAAGKRLLGITGDDPIRLSDHHAASVRKFLDQEAIPSAIRDGVWTGETLLKSRTGEEICVSQVLIAHKSSTGRLEFMSTIARDIRGQKRLEAQFQQAQKMEAVGRLAGGVAHDFNNLLTVINGYAELAMTTLRSADPLYGQLEQIRGAGERAASLTRQLLAFSRKQMLMPVVLNLNNLVSEMEKMLRRMIGEDIDLVFQAAADLWPIKADPGQMEQVVMNLVVNARDAMPKGGKLTIETANVRLSESYMSIQSEARSG